MSVKVGARSFLHSFTPSLLSSLLPSFTPSFLPSLLHSSFLTHLNGLSRTGHVHAVGQVGPLGPGVLGLLAEHLVSLVPDVAWDIVGLSVLSE